MAGAGKLSSQKEPGDGLTSRPSEKIAPARRFSYN